MALVHSSGKLDELQRHLEGQRSTSRISHKVSALRRSASARRSRWTATLQVGLQNVDVACFGRHCFGQDLRAQRRRLRAILTLHSPIC